MKTRELGRVFVTGADGFIGSHLVDALVEQGHQVTAMCIYNSNSSYGWLSQLALSQPKNLNLILGDVRDPYFMEASIQNHDTVFHLASLIAIPYSYVAPYNYVETNVLGTLNTAQASVKAKVKRFIHTSTSEVYGTAQIVPIAETHPLQGQSPYSASKIGADMMVESYYRSFGLPAITVRPFNTYGPRQSLRAVIPTIIYQILAGSKEIRLGSITPTRDLNYVGDTVAAFIKTATTDAESMLGQAFNAGSEREISIEDLTHLIADKLGTRVTIIEEQKRLRPEQSEVQRLLSDSSKLRKATGWAPKVSLEDGLVKTAEWVKASSDKKLTSIYHI